MALQPVIRLGDTTSHGGIVVEGFTNHIVLGIPVAGLGHAVKCPKCKGVYPIVECIKSYTVDGVGVAVHGMLTGCGSVLFASQNLFFLDRAEGESHIGVKKDSVLIAHEPLSASSAFGYDLFFHLKNPETGVSQPQMPYKITLEDGREFVGVSDKHGLTEKVSADSPQTAKLEAPYFDNDRGNAYTHHGSDACSC